MSNLLCGKTALTVRDRDGQTVKTFPCDAPEGHDGDCRVILRETIRVPEGGSVYGGGTFNISG